MRNKIFRIKGLLRNERGFGFAELMISTTILFLSILAFTSLMGSSLEYMGTTQVKTMGYNLATKSIEDLKDLDYASVDSSGPDTLSQDGFTYTRNIIVLEIDNSSPLDGIMDVKKVTIDLSWDKPFSGSYSAVTYLNPYGAVESVPSAPADIVAPDIQVTYPSSAGSITGLVSLQASANDLYGVTKVEIFIDDVLVETDLHSPVTPGTFLAAHTWDTTLLSDGIHTVFAKAYDDMGNIGISQSIGYLIVNSPAGDAVAPTAPGFLNARRSYTLMGLPTNKIDLAWGAATDNIGVSWYRVERWSLDGTTLLKTELTTSLTTVDFVATDTTVHRYKIFAIDGSGNESPASNWTIPDGIQSPSTPTNLDVVERTGNRLTFQWDPSVDNGLVTIYHVYNFGIFYESITPSTPTVSTTINYGGGNKDWAFSVTATDDLGLESNMSVAVTWKSF